MNSFIKLYVIPISNYPIILGADISRKFRVFPPEIEVIPPGESIELPDCMKNKIETPMEDKWFLQNLQEFDESQTRDLVTGEYKNDEIFQFNSRHQHKSVEISLFMDKLMKDFEANLSNEPPPFKGTGQFTHTINLKDPSIVPQLKPYRVANNKKEALDLQIQSLLKAGYIRPSNSPYSSPCLFVPKADGSWRLCIDYRQLNSNTIDDKFPLPSAEELLDSVGNSGFITKLDFTSGYHQLGMDEKSIPLTAFSTPYGLYEWLTMPFGLKNAPATFQRVMNYIFRDYLNKWLVVYLDDLLIFDHNRSEHMKHIRQVFSVLKQYGFVAKPSKCLFFMKQVNFLGHIISANGIKTSDSKIQALINWELPKTNKGMQSFVGFVSYYRKFVLNFSKIIRPLILCGLGKLRTNRPEVKLAFETIKQKLINAPILKSPRNGATYVITADASQFAVGAVIEILNDSGKVDGTVAYYSKSISKFEMNYPVREKELLAIIKVLVRYRHFLLGHHIIIKTDHQSLSYLLRSKGPPSARLARWLEILCQYDIDIHYIKGKTNIADALSRKFELSLKETIPKSGDDMEDIVYINNTETNNDSTEVVDVTAMDFTNQTLGNEFLNELKQAYADDEALNEIYNIFKNDLPIPKSIKHHIKNFVYEDGFIFFKGFDAKANINYRLWIPNSLQYKVVHSIHSAITNLHPGAEVTFLQLVKYFYWPRMVESVKRIVRNCSICQAIKPRNHSQFGLLQSLPDPTERWSSISMDFVGGFPMVDNKDYILVIVDRFTKRAHFIPCAKTITAKQTARLFVETIFKLHGLPDEIISDNDVRFTSNFWLDFFSELKVLLKFSTVYHPQTDGQTERTNRTLIQLLKAFADYGDAEWLLKLPITEYAYNAHYHKAIKMSPFEADIGYIPKAPHFDTRVLKFSADRMVPNAALTGTDFARMLHYQNELVKNNIMEAQANAEKVYNKHREELLLKVRDEVLVHRNAKMFSGNFKLTKQGNLFFGPYAVSKIFPDNPNIYELEVGIHPSYDRIFNVKNLKPYVKDRIMFPRDPPRNLNALRVFAREDKIKAIVGVNLLDKEVALTFKECDPNLAVIFDIGDLKSACPPPLFLKLFQTYDKESAVTPDSHGSQVLDDDTIVEEGSS
ncbi:hypothetical protein KGF54_002184 [Candida jiufengensis]|uniref:uncharacterized protein n=1 Tax=Candida jiufengensis TaxID=497108 RepID=UPI0022252920|nr:uncharacterized protein KGF54_002184 [Candida jiufengensis]KAI5954409.1 hypothetical protein KGF54_002184 [Candida jiufengensis]